MVPAETGLGLPMKTIVRNGVRALAVVLALALAACGDSFEDGMAAYEAGDHDTAIAIWRPLAERGDARAQYNLGVMYRDSLGLPQDHVVAARWFRRAADRNFAPAQTNLCIAYANGQGVPRSPSACQAMPAPISGQIAIFEYTRC